MRNKKGNGLANECWTLKDKSLIALTYYYSCVHTRSLRTTAESEAEVEGKSTGRQSERTNGGKFCNVRNYWKFFALFTNLNRTSRQKFQLFPMIGVQIVEDSVSR